MLIIGLSFGFLASLTYIFPDFLKQNLSFISLRPMHVSSALFWIILGATGCVYNGLQRITGKTGSKTLAIIQWLLWLIGIVGIFYSYFNKNFGGREYWEFNPIWALPIALAWILFLINFVSIIRKINNWPVYIWMWLTGLIFFLFTYLENYLWLFPYFRENFVTDMTIQWKVNGSIVGAWNQILYGTAFYLMDRIENKKTIGSNKLAFAMWFLGLVNLMFNWGHHIYTLPTEKYIRYVGYAVSMTEWIFLLKIIYHWKQSLNSIQKNYHYFPFRFLMMADFWVLLNLGQAILMSIPAINIYTHGTHVTVAHAMGTTIGINSMILMAACFEFIFPYENNNGSHYKFIVFNFWLLQASLLVFWLSLNIAGIKKGIWQLSQTQVPYAHMMHSLHSYFILFVIGGLGILISFISIAYFLLKFALNKKKYLNLS